MLKYLIIAVALVVVLVLVYAARRPGDFRVERKLMIQAPPEKIEPHLTDFHTWVDWSPYEKMDPAMKRLFSGPEQGQGAIYAWYSDGEPGQGEMEVLEATPQRVLIRLDFIRPFTAHNTAEFTLQPQNGGTLVTWAMYGRQPYVAKVMTLFFNMDKMVGKDFETGLSSLKTICEK